MNYNDFLAKKHLSVHDSGFTPKKLNQKLFDWQADVVTWACKRGKTALLEDCGLGKTIQQLAWAEQVVRHTNKPVLIICPIAVAPQTLKEADKFNINIEIKIAKDQSQVKPGITLTNYERLHLFDPLFFSGVVIDESSILKSFTGKIKQQLCEAFARTPYRMACTATPAPNDHMELGTHSEFLSVMQREVMLAKYFIHDGGDTAKWRLKRHGVSDFWRWVASWAVSISKPSDIGYSDKGFNLPPLKIHEHYTKSGIAEGTLFGIVEAVSATNVHDVKREGLKLKAEKVASLVNGNKESWACWCDTNYEADELKRHLPDAVEVRGSDDDDSRAEKLTAFTRGKARVIVTKPEIGGFGLNWQHCANTTYFAGFSFERWYQSIRRLWRFGQKREVNVHLIMSETEASILEVLKRKQMSYEEMTGEMCRSMKEGMQAELHGAKPLEKYKASQTVKKPAWSKS